MIVWICDSCGCEIKEKKPEECPLCGAPAEKFFEGEVPDPKPEDKEFTKKYDEVIDKLDKYTEDCDPEDSKYAFEE